MDAYPRVGAIGGESILLSTFRGVMAWLRRGQRGYFCGVIRTLSSVSLILIVCFGCRDSHEKTPATTNPTAEVVTLPPGPGAGRYTLNPVGETGIKIAYLAWELDTPEQISWLPVGMVKGLTTVSISATDMLTPALTAAFEEATARGETPSLFLSLPVITRSPEALAILELEAEAFAAFDLPDAVNRFVLLQPVSEDLVEDVGDFWRIASDTVLAAGKIATVGLDLRDFDRLIPHQPDLLKVGWPMMLVPHRAVIDEGQQDLFYRLTQQNVSILSTGYRELFDAQVGQVDEGFSLAQSALRWAGRRGLTSIWVQPKSRTHMDELVAALGE